MKKVKIFLLGLSVIASSGCGIFTNTISQSKIDKYERKIWTQYRDTTYSKVLKSKGIDVDLVEHSKFPYFASISVSLHDSIPTIYDFIIEYSFKDPYGKTCAFNYKSNFDKSEEKIQSLSGIHGYGDALKGYFKVDNLSAGIYEYHEQFIMGSAEYQIYAQFYHDPKTMNFSHGSQNNNGYWMNEND